MNDACIYLGVGLIRMRPIAELEQRHGNGHDEPQYQYVKYTSDVVQRQLGVAERLLWEYQDNTEVCNTSWQILVLFFFLL